MKWIVTLLLCVDPHLRGWIEDGDCDEILEVLAALERS